MKKIGLLFVVIAFLFGCGTATQKAEFWSHPTHYKSKEHLKFSWSGFKKPTKEHVKLSAMEGWWGEPVNYEGLGD